MDIAQFLLMHQNNAHIAIQKGKEIITYKALNQKSYAFAQMLTKESGENIGLFIPNSIHYAIAYFGILFARKTIVVFNTQLTVPEVTGIALESEMKTLVTLALYKEAFKDLEESLHIIYIDEVALETSLTTNQISLSPITGDEIAIIFPTSGTTGMPKLVMLSHNALNNGVKWVLETMPTDEHGRELVIIPFCAVFINNEQLLLNIYQGATLVLYEGRIKLNKFFEMVEKEKITRCIVVPSVLKMIAEYYKPEKHHIETLERVVIGGEKMDQEDFEFIREKLDNVKILQSYGMTEASTAICHKTYEDWNKYTESVGRIVGEIELKVIDKTGKEVEAGELGEIIIKSPAVMRGYYGKDEAFLEEGWLHTGDIGTQNEAGYVYIMGRKKNVIISGGRNIFPEEVEGIIRKHEMISELKVYGEKNESAGEIVVAQIVLAEGVPFDLNTLLAYCERHLAFYKIPKQFYVVPELEKTASNKIKRR